jgi:hypothetical protein
VVKDPRRGETVTADLTVLAAEYSPLLLQADEFNHLTILVHAPELFVRDGRIPVFLGVSEAPERAVTEETLKGWFEEGIDVTHVDTAQAPGRSGGISVLLPFDPDDPTVRLSIKPIAGWEGWIQIHTPETETVAHYFAAITFGPGIGSSIRVAR